MARRKLSEGARKLHELMEARELSQRAVEAACGVDSGVVTRWLTGERVPSGPSRTAIEHAFGIKSTLWDEPCKAA